MSASLRLCVCSGADRVLWYFALFAFRFRVFDVVRYGIRFFLMIVAIASLRLLLTRHTPHCTLHTTHYTRHTTYDTRHTTHYTTHCTLQHTTHYTLHTAHYTLHTAHYNTLHTTHYTLHTTHYTLHTTHYSYTRYTHADTQHFPQHFVGCVSDPRASRLGGHFLHIKHVDSEQVSVQSKRAKQAF